ncbi:hypothetical protein AZE42_09377 [Rhizopogon vesiculosus]|uniref:IRG-type G domain-containing protein n=1 Tax=Rhizopogon vesiculosus TaxID=180088 RepID=A0A1J8Q4Q9_9AGAM|nr:hypothetical protein AZE42_09377 [Rhizopogon vesiculosus]
MEAQHAAMRAAAAAQAQSNAEMMAMIQAERAANEARMQAEAVARTASDKVKQLKQRVAEVEEEKVKKTNAAKEKAERQLKEGIQPVVAPTPEEVGAAKRKVQYQEDLFHFAVAGVAGGGKSSLINAMRGLRNKDKGSAATGVTETALAVSRYANANAEYPYVWYDIPGAGTLKIPDWQYFNAQRLYVFDCIIVLFDNRFTMTDIAILTNCRRFKIPTYIVRSKADQHVRNLMRDMGYDSDDEDDEDRKKKLYQNARQQFIEQTCRSVKDSLENANIPDQRVYIISKDAMLDVVKEKHPKEVIDEIALLNGLLREAQVRRVRIDTETANTKGK